MAIQGGPVFPAYPGYAPSTPFDPHMTGFPSAFGAYGAMNINMDMMGMPFQHPQQPIMPAMTMMRDTSPMIDQSKQASNSTAGPFAQQSDANTVLRQTQEMDTNMHDFEINADLNTDNTNSAATADIQPGRHIDGAGSAVHANGNTTVGTKAMSTTTSDFNGQRYPQDGQSHVANSTTTTQNNSITSSSLQVQHQQADDRSAQAQMTVQLPPRPQSVVAETEALGLERALQEPVVV
jgi:hypothetical protein